VDQVADGKINSSAAINGKIVVSIGALKPLPHHPQQYPEQCEACGKAKREVNCVGAHVGAPQKQWDWGDGTSYPSTLLGQLSSRLDSNMNNLPNMY
jgi:hypothetical protein